MIKVSCKSQDGQQNGSRYNRGHSKFCSGHIGDAQRQRDLENENPLNNIYIYYCENINSKIS